MQGLTDLLFSPLTRQASNEELVGAVLHHCSHNFQLVQVYDGVGLCEAQRYRNVVVIVIGPPYLHTHTYRPAPWTPGV